MRGETNLCWAAVTLAVARYLRLSRPEIEILNHPITEVCRISHEDPQECRDQPRLISRTLNVQNVRVPSTRSREHGGVYVLKMSHKSAADAIRLEVVDRERPMLLQVSYYESAQLVHHVVIVGGYGVTIDGEIEVAIYDPMPYGELASRHHTRARPTWIRLADDMLIHGGVPSHLHRLKHPPLKHPL